MRSDDPSDPYGEKDPSDPYGDKRQRREEEDLSLPIKKRRIFRQMEKDLNENEENIGEAMIEEVSAGLDLTEEQISAHRTAVAKTASDVWGGIPFTTDEDKMKKDIRKKLNQYRVFDSDYQKLIRLVRKGTTKINSSRPGPWYSDVKSYVDTDFRNQKYLKNAMELIGKWKDYMHQEIQRATGRVRIDEIVELVSYRISKSMGQYRGLDPEIAKQNTRPLLEHLIANRKNFIDLVHKEWTDEYDTLVLIKKMPRDKLDKATSLSEFKNLVRFVRRYKILEKSLKDKRVWAGYDEIRRAILNPEKAEKAEKDPAPLERFALALRTDRFPVELSTYILSFVTGKVQDLGKNLFSHALSQTTESKALNYVTSIARLCYFHSWRPSLVGTPTVDQIMNILGWDRPNVAKFISKYSSYLALGDYTSSNVPYEFYRDVGNVVLEGLGISERVPIGAIPFRTLQPELVTLPSKEVFFATIDDLELVTWAKKVVKRDMDEIIANAITLAESVRKGLEEFIEEKRKSTGRSDATIDKAVCDEALSQITVAKRPLHSANKSTDDRVLYLMDGRGIVITRKMFRNYTAKVALYVLTLPFVQKGAEDYYRNQLMALPIGRFRYYLIERVLDLNKELNIELPPEYPLEDREKEIYHNLILDPSEIETSKYFFDTWYEDVPMPSFTMGESETPSRLEKLSDHFRMFMVSYDGLIDRIQNALMLIDRIEKDIENMCKGTIPETPEGRVRPLSEFRPEERMSLESRIAKHRAFDRLGWNCRPNPKKDTIKCLKPKEETVVQSMKALTIKEDFDLLF